jgi:Putative phage serine protease XkdF
MLLTIDIDEETGKVTIDPSRARKQAAKEWDGRSIAAQLVKSAPERRYSLCLAYPCLRADQAVASDGHRDFASAQAVEDGAWNFLQKGGNVGLFHANGTDNAGTCVESYIWRPDHDWIIKAANGTEQVIHTGDWLVGIVWTPKAWGLIKSGQVTGVSMQGSAIRRQPSPEALASLRP